MAGVYKAVHRIGQVVAIKVLPPSKVKDAQAFGRFQREARLAVKLKHPNVVRTFHTGQADKLHYLYGTLSLLAVLAPWMYAPAERRGRLAWFTGATLVAGALAVRAYMTAT